MNQQEYIQELMSKARFLSTFDVYKTVLRDGNLIKLNRMYWQGYIHKAQMLELADLKKVQFEPSIEGYTAEMKTSLDPYFELGCIGLLYDVMNYVNKRDE